MDQEETLEWLTGAFSNKRLGAIIKAAKVANPEKTIVLAGSGSTLSASGFPSADSAEEAEGAFACRIQESGSAFMAVFAKPDKRSQAIGSDYQDWVGFSYSLDGSQIGFASLGYLRSANAVTVASGVVYVPKASAISLLSVAMAGTAREAYADQSANAYSENPIASKVILAAIANLTAGISVDAQGNVNVLGTLSVQGTPVAAVSRADFDNSKASLDGLKIGAASYKVVPCGNASGSGSTASGSGSTASGTNSTASGINSTASGTNSTAIGAYSAVSGAYSTASGTNSTASGTNSTAIGAYSTVSGTNSTAIGHGSLSKIDNFFVISSTSTNRYYSAYSPDYIFFFNENVSNSYTAKSQYANGKAMTDYIGAGSPTIVTTETIEGMIAGTSANFSVTGSGTSGSPYIITPKADLSHPHQHRVYQISVTSAPTADAYVRFKASGTERCLIQFTLNAAGAHGYIINFQNLYGWTRSRNVLNGGTLSSTDINTSTATGKTLIDVNSDGIYTSYAL